MNQVAVEALYSATYVENYLDSMDNLPDDVQKYFSRIRELDIQFRNYLRDADHFQQQWANSPTNELESANAKRSRTMSRFQQSLIAAQDIYDEKMELGQQLQELIDHKVRQLEHDHKNLDYGQDDMMQTDVGKESYFAGTASPVPNSPSAHSTTALTFGSGAQAFSSLATHGNGGGNGLSSSNSSHNGSSAGANGNSSYGQGGSGSGKRARRMRTDAGDMGSSDSNLENNGKGLSYSGSTSMNVSGSASGTGTQQGNRKNQQAANNSGKKKKRKTRVQGAGGAGIPTAGGSTLGVHASASSRDMRDDTPPQEDTIDPDEPTYCLCDQISFGEMILCDNDLCPIEWFHFSCVMLVSKPKGKWYCPNCRGDRPNIMKNKAQFLKELERYNKEREEKT